MATTIRASGERPVELEIGVHRAHIARKAGVSHSFRRLYLVFSLVPVAGSMDLSFFRRAEQRGSPAVRPRASITACWWRRSRDAVASAGGAIRRRCGAKARRPITIRWSRFCSAARLARGGRAQGGASIRASRSASERGVNANDRAIYHRVSIFLQWPPF
jgi:hypothetical protein